MTGNIFIIGPMGAGKTVIGRRLAKELKCDFLDSDQEIEKRTGASISLIFEIEGELGFRKRECTMLEELTQRQGAIISTGGGVVIERKNRELLARHGFVIYLHAPLDKLIERTSRDRNRPLLQTEKPRKRLEALIDERDPLYRQVADLIIDTGHRTVRNIVHDLVDKIKRYENTEGRAG